MQIARYWRVACHRTWRDLDRMTGGLPSIPLIVLFGILPIAERAWRLPRTTPREQIIPTILGDPWSWSAFILEALIFVCFLLFVTPGRIHKEQETKIAALREAMSAETHGLVELHAAGVALRNRALEFRSNSEWIPWHTEYLEWEASVIAEMQRIHMVPSLVSNFQTLDIVPPLPFTIVMSLGPPVYKDLAELTEKLQRLRAAMHAHDTRRRPLEL